MIGKTLLRFDRNVHVLFVAQALANTSTALVVTTSALAAQTIALDKTLVTLPLALQQLGTMASTAGASLLMQRIGRRAGFSIAAMILMAAGFLSAYALAIRSFGLLCGAGILFGVFNAFAMYYRFTAAEVTAEASRGKAIAYVLTGGVVAAFCGPALAAWGRTLLAPVLFAGSYAVPIGLGLATLLLMRWLAVPGLSPVERKSSGRPLGAIARQPAFVVALLAATVGYGSMTTVMTSTPLAMADCGHSFGDTAFVIQWHVLGMYGSAFFVGGVIARFGELRVMLAGVACMLSCAAINLSGIAVVNFWAALCLMGLGWSCLFVGATTLLTRVHVPAERGKVQALNDTVVFSVVAAGALGSGALENTLGWQAVNLAIVPALVIVAAAVIRLSLRPRALPA